MWAQKPPLGTSLDWSNPLNGGLVMHLAMNEGHGDVVHDLSMYGNHGTLNGFAFPPTVASGWNPGRSGRCLKFDGGNDYIDCGNNPSLGTGRHYNFYGLSPKWTTISGDPAARHNFSPVHKTEISEVNKTVDGSVRKFLAYDCDPVGAEIRLYYTDDLDGVWTAYSGNPILGPTANVYRWPSTAYDSGTFHMFLMNCTNTRMERWTSADGINYAFQENVVNTANSNYMNPYIWFNPNDNEWYLYHKEIGPPQILRVRNEANILNIGAGTDRTITIDEDKAAPSIMYQDGYYWLFREGLSGDWRVSVYYSLQPDSGFTKCLNSPILVDDEACPIAIMGPGGSKAYLFTSRDKVKWYQDTREIYPNLRPAWRLYDEITISIWINPTTYDATTRPILRLPGGYTLVSQLNTSNVCYFSLNIDGAVRSLTGDAIPIDTWSNIAATYSKYDKTLRIFQNGVQTAHSILGGLSDYYIDRSESPLYIGKYSGLYSNSSIDEVRIQSRAWSAKECMDYAINPWQVYLDE